MGRNRVKRRMIMDAIRGDPAWKNGDYTEAPKQGLTAALNILLMMGSSPLPAVWKPHLAAFLSDLAVPAAAAAPSPEAEELKALEQRLVAAIGARDLATYDTLVAADYVVVEAAGTVRTKADVMASYRDGTRGYRDLKIDEVQAHVFGDTAVVHARTTGTRILNGKEELNRVRYVRVYARRSGRWQAVAQMATPLPGGK